MRPALLALGLLALVAAGCGGGGGETATTGGTAEETTALRVYFLRDGKVAPFAREVPKMEAVAAAALDELSAGFTASEADPRLENEIPEGAEFSDLRADDRVASVELEGDWSRAALAQVVYTLTQFLTVRTVEIGGKRYTRADFEDLTPAVLVESPLPFETVQSPLRATGTANTFEATFQYDLMGPGDQLLAQHFVTATSGSGTRGTFDFTVPYVLDEGGEGTLVVYEISAEDGSRIHEVEIPLRLQP